MGAACDIGAVESCADEVPEGLGNALMATKQSVILGAPLAVKIDILLDAPTRWNLYRDSEKEALGSRLLIRGREEPSFVDLGAAGPRFGDRFFYLARGVSDCRGTPGP